MAKFKRSRRRYYRKSWSTRLTSINVSQLVAPGTPVLIYRTLATNPAQDDNSVSQRFTVKNVNVQVEVSNDNTTGDKINLAQHYILYIPQGYTLTADTPYEHPEWIMAHRFIGSPVNTTDPGYAPLRITTRLARKLDTGDRVVYLFLASNISTTAQATINLNGLVKLNTKAN